jgi:hypothetical protein
MLVNPVYVPVDLYFTLYLLPNKPFRIVLEASVPSVGVTAAANAISDEHAEIFVAAAVVKLKFMISVQEAPLSMLV